jgi:multiple sugar transport system substrate-binding protein
MKRTVVLLLAMIVISAFSLAAAPVTIEFIQWWEPQMPAGSFQGPMDQFEAQNPGIKVKLISGPDANTHDQIVAGAPPRGRSVTWWALTAHG